jgi:alpha/beta superfamily hydrolase
MKITHFELINIPGPVGKLETQVLQNSNQQPARGIALVTHPNPLEGGTFDNKVVHTLAKTLSQLGYIAYCPNLRGVGNSEGEHDHGHAEVDDVEHVLQYARHQHGNLPVVLAGFSFGTYVQSQFRQRLNDEEVDGMILVGTAISRHAFPDVPSSTFLIHGEEDDVIPLIDVLNWLRPQGIPITVVPGVGHMFHGKLATLSALITTRWRPRS